jgi:hypothetical protein
MSLAQGPCAENKRSAEPATNYSRDCKINKLRELRLDESQGMALRHEGILMLSPTTRSAKAKVLSLYGGHGCLPGPCPRGRATLSPVDPAEISPSISQMAALLTQKSSQRNHHH